MLEQSQLFEQILDRRLKDFEKVVDTRLSSIQEGVNSMKDIMAIFVDKVANLHKDYIPRSEAEKEYKRINEEIQAANDEIEKLEDKVEKLQAWRNYLAGAIAILGFSLGLIVESHFWSK